MKREARTFRPASLTVEPTYERVFPSDRNVVFTNYGKTAIERIVQREELAGTTILLPALLVRDCFETIFDEYGIEPIFVDVNPRTYQMDFAEASRKIGDADSLLLLHTYGVPADASRWRRLASNHDVLLIEDCARALGATVEGRPVGSFGDFAVFSLHKVTPLVEGGALVGRFDGTGLDPGEVSLSDVQPFLPESIRSATASGYRWLERLADAGDDPAADGWNHSLHQLDRLNEYLFYYHLARGFERRVRRNLELARRIRSSLEPYDLEFQSTPHGTCPFHYVGISVSDRRDDLVRRLRRTDIPVTTLWRSPLPTAYLEPRHIVERYPHTRKLMETGLQLPVVEMDETDVSTAIELITDATS